jgi:hypothetical protein
MIERIIGLAIQRRWVVVALAAVLMFFGGFALTKLPIDAVPDITNNQVQINVRASALSPELVEKQVAFPIETALAGIPGLNSTRSLSRNGFAQVTAVFTDATDIYFARQQVAERLRDRARENLPKASPRKWGRSRPALARSICGPSTWLIAPRTSTRPASRASSPTAATSRRKATGWSATLTRRPICALRRTGSSRRCSSRFPAWQAWTRSVAM